MSANVTNLKQQPARADEAARNEVPERAPAPPPEPVARGEAPSAQTETPVAHVARKGGRNFLRLLLMAGGIFAVVALGTGYWLHGGRWVSSDDAYIRAPKLMVSTDVSGIVSSVDVSEGARVKAGDILFRVDPAQFEIALQLAKAQLVSIRTGLQAAHGDYAQLQAGIAAQTAQVALAQATNDRAEGLARTSSGTQASLDQARFTLLAAQKQLEAMKRQSEAALTRLGGAEDFPVEQTSQYLAAQAGVAEAQRQLDHTVVRAPFSGIVTAVDRLQPGAFLVSQTAALTNTGAVALVASDGFYIEANVKETDLTFIKSGDSVDFTVDAYPGHAFKGEVDSISPATGSEFALIPAQNASGNWVKVVQRVPVRIKVKPGADDPRLLSGMSVVVEIDSGHIRRLSDLWDWGPAPMRSRPDAAVGH